MTVEGGVPVVLNWNMHNLKPVRSIARNQAHAKSFVQPQLSFVKQRKMDRT